MPSWTTASPRGVPSRLIFRELTFPECEISSGFLGFVDFDAHAVDHFIQITMRQLAIVFECSDPEIDISARLIGVTVVEQFLDESNDIGDMLCNPRFDIRLFDID